MSLRRCSRFEFVRRAIRQDALQVDDGVGRIGRRVDHLSGEVVRLIASALIPEHTNIAGPPVAQAEIQPRAEDLRTNFQISIFDFQFSIVSMRFDATARNWLDIEN